MPLAVYEPRYYEQAAVACLTLTALEIVVQIQESQSARG